MGGFLIMICLTSKRFSSPRKKLGRGKVKNQDREGWSLWWKTRPPARVGVIMENPKLLLRQSHPSKRSHKRHPVLPSNLHITSEGSCKPLSSSTEYVLSARAASGSTFTSATPLLTSPFQVSQGNSKGLGVAQV